MEKHENRQKRGKEKARIGFNGGNIGGLVVWGGALAVMSMIAAISIKKSRRNKCDASRKGDDDVIHDTPASTIHEDQCRASYGSDKMVEAKIDSCDCDVVSPKSLISELGSNPVIIPQNENSNVDSASTFIANDSKEENGETCKDCIQVEEFSSASTENDTSNFSGEELPLTESVNVTEEKETCDRESITAEDSSPKESVEIEQPINDVAAGDIDSTIPELHEIKPLDYTSYTSSWDHSVEEQSLEPAFNNGNQNSTTDPEPEGIAISDDSKEEITESCIGLEEFSTSETASCGTENGRAVFSGEDLVMEEKENYDTEKLTSEENTPKESVEDISDGVGCEDSNEEKDSNSSEEIMIEDGSEGSEEGIEAIWPAEEIEALALELKNHQKTEEQIVGEGDLEHIQIEDERRKSAYDHELTENSTILLSKGSSVEFVTMNDEINHSRNRRFWSSLMLGVLVLLLLLFTHGGALSHYLFNREPSLSNEL
ncbi:hypothetical protein K2173_026298 [Erythroxylum novogranatense]|uniref:Uncharacterized protein n=1 Tax=Erythroxylum novogranatense TaxID=1862640 RepID=A0AAV8SBZ4_9ROSI|nr:hypothetical protein K2173_026298 [Erythroxylum novogranatense]